MVMVMMIATIPVPELLSTAPSAQLKDEEGARGAEASQRAISYPGRIPLMQTTDRKHGISNQLEETGIFNHSSTKAPQTGCAIPCRRVVSTELLLVLATF